MDDREYIKEFTREELIQMNKEFLVNRNQLLYEQIKIRSEREADCRDIIDLSIKMLQLQKVIIKNLTDEFIIEILNNPELSNKVDSMNNKIGELAIEILSKHSSSDYDLDAISLAEYLKAEGLDDNIS